MKKRTPIFSKTILLGEIQYEILDITGEGGSCIVYNAVYKDSVGTPHNVRIKELYPFTLHADRTEDNVLHFQEKDVFDGYRQRFLHAAEMQRKIRAESGTVNTSARLYDTVEANGTLYQILEYYNGLPFSLSCTGNLEKYLSVLLQTACTLKTYHQNGYLHLDIKPANLYYLPPQYDAMHSCGSVLLLDFDSIIRKSEVDTATRSYSAGYAAPELKNGEIVSEKTDFYSIGALLFQTIMQRFPSALDGDYFSTWEFDRGERLFGNVKEDFFDLLTDFFHKTLSTWPDDRYCDDDELILALTNLRDAAYINQPYLESNFTMPVNNCFIGRSQELKELEQKLRDYSHVFLQGIGGNGKTLLAMQYAWKHRAEYDHILFAKYNGSFSQLLCDDFSIPIGNLSTEEYSEDYAQRKFDILRELCNNRVLLILDNCDIDDVAELEDWLNLSCHILITSRMQLSDNLNDTIIVSGLREAEALFKHYCARQFNQEDQDCICKLIDYIAYHTMTVELLAKLMRDSSVSPKYVYELFLAADSNSLPEHSIRNVKDASYQNQSVNSYMDILFALFNFSEEEKLLLQSLALLADQAFYRPLFLKWCPFVQETVLNRLIYKGWIQEDRSFELLILHPIIMDRLLLHLPPDAGTMDRLLVNLTDKLCNTVSRASPMMEICKTIEKRIKGSSSAFAFLQYYMGMYSANSETALHYYDKSSAFFMSNNDEEMLEKIKILQTSLRILLCLQEYEECDELIQTYLELLDSDQPLYEDHYFYNKVGSYCQSIAMKLQMMMGEEEPFWEHAEKYYLYAFQSDKAKETTGAILHDFYDDLFNPLYSAEKAEEYVKYIPQPQLVSINGVPWERNALYQKVTDLQNMLIDDNADGFSALGRELAEHYLNDSKAFSSFDLMYIQEALERSGQIELHERVFDQYHFEDDPVLCLSIARMYLKLGNREKAYPLLKRSEEHQLRLIENGTHDTYHQLALAEIYFLLLNAADEQELIHAEEVCSSFCDTIVSEIIEPDALHYELKSLSISRAALEQASNSLSRGQLLEAKSFLNFFAFAWHLDTEEGSEELCNTYLEICDQITDADDRFLYCYFTFCAKVMENYEADDDEQQNAYSEMCCNAAESAAKTFGTDDIRTALALQKAAEAADKEERAELLASVNYEAITRHEIQKIQEYPYRDTSSIYFSYWGKCAENYRSTGNGEKHDEIMRRLNDEMERIKAENPADYFDALQEAEHFYASLTDGMEKAMAYALKQWELLPLEADLQDKFQLCRRIASYYERLHNIQHEDEQHSDEVFWLKKALHLTEAVENLEKLNEIRYVELLERLAQADSAQKDYYNKLKIQFLQSKLVET